MAGLKLRPRGWRDITTDKHLPCTQLIWVPFLALNVIPPLPSSSGVLLEQKSLNITEYYTPPKKKLKRTNFSQVTHPRSQLYCSIEQGYILIFDLILPFLSWSLPFTYYVYTESPSLLHLLAYMTPGHFLVIPCI